MNTDIGEFIVGAYLKVIKECDVIDYNVRPPGGGLKGLNELDVIGLDFKTNTAYLCEVTTHIDRLVIGANYKATVNKIKDKHERQKEYAKEYLEQFKNHAYMFWSPCVAKGYITENLDEIETLEKIINGKYKKRVEELRQKAKEYTHNVGNPFFRMLQIMEHMNDR